MVSEAQQVAASSGVLGPLGIDGKLFVAQLVNFGIVAFVLWRWAYVPLLKVMDDRAKKIAQGLKDADASAIARKAAEEDAAAIVAEARHKAKAIIDQAAGAAEAERQEAAQRARAEAEKILGQGRELLDAEKAKLLAEVKAEAGTLVTMAAERILKAKLDGKKDAALIASAIHDIERSV